MQTIGSFLGSQYRRDYRPVKELPDVGKVGIEIELERGNFGEVRGWSLHGDGSLRDGGVEYVFNGAQGGETALASIMEMGEALKKARPHPSFRCSTHIHLDCRDLNLLQVSKYVAIYSLFEDVMFAHCQDYRKYSNFCVPYMINDALINKVSGAIQGNFNSVASWRCLARYPKYSALNLQPLTRFGSIEFRGSHAMTTSEELLGLAQRVLCLKEVVVNLSNDEETLLDFIQRVNKFQVGDAFPLGITKEIKRDQETLDVCYSNALLLDSGMKPAPENDVLERLAVPPRPAGWAQAAPAEATLRVNINREGFERYGLFQPADLMSGRDVKATLKAFENIRGIRAPRFVDLFSFPVEWTELMKRSFVQYLNE